MMDSMSTVPRLGPADEVIEDITAAGPIGPSRLLFDKYQAIGKLGQGGMGAIWLVRHLELQCLRVLKTIVSGLAIHPEAQERFCREARIMAAISTHPNAVVVHDAR